MGVSELNYISDIAIIVGLTVPLFSIFSGAIGQAFDFACHIDTGPDGLVPFNIVSLCVALIVFGGTEKILLYCTSNILILVLISTVVALQAYIVFYHAIVKKLAKSKPKAITPEELLGATGTMVLRATKSEFGTVSVVDSNGAKITYKALVTDSSTYNRIEQGEQVIIDTYHTVSDVCYVSIKESKE